MACESAEPVFDSAEAGPRAADTPQGATPSAAPTTERAPEPVRRIESADPLPAVASSFAPRLDVVRGRCSVTLKRLAPSVLDRVRAEFEARNPGGEVKQIDPLTGRLEDVSFPRHEANVGPRVELSDEALQSRRLSPLRRNADLFGLTAADLNSLEWKLEPEVDPKRELLTTRGNIPCRDEAGRLGAGPNPCWRIVVDLLQDGVVSSVQVNRFGPPVPMSTTPAISEATVIATAGLKDARARGLSGRTPKKAVVEATLSIERSFDETLLSAPSVTWRLVWTAKVPTVIAPRIFVFDASNGELLDIHGGFEGGFVGRD